MTWSMRSGRDERNPAQGYNPVIMCEMKFAKTAALEAAIVRKPLNNLVGDVNELDCDSDLYVPRLR